MKPPPLSIRLGGLLLWMLTVLFVCLKVCGNIDWSWWKVTAPLWMPTVLALGAVLVLLLGMLLVVAIVEVWDELERRELI